MSKGGSRPGSGRKPFAPGLSKSHRSKAVKTLKIDVARNLETSDALSCPKDMSEAAKAKWRGLMKLYRRMPSQVLNDLDVDALRQYCEAFAVYKAAENIWVTKLQGTIATTSEETQRVIDKTLSTMNRQSAVMSSLAEQLLLTPVGRARMGMNPAAPKKGGKLDSFLRSIQGESPVDDDGPIAKS